MSRRIIVHEKVLDITEDEIASHELTGIPIKDEDYDSIYLRRYVPVVSIFGPAEIAGDPANCILEFTDGNQIIIKGSFEDICKKLDKLNTTDAE
jgi:hypothetical protein